VNDDEVIDRADANYFDSWGLVAERCRHGSARRRPGLALASSGLPLAFLNVAFVTGPAADAAATVSEAAAFFAERPVPWLLRIRAGVDERFEEMAESAGLRYVDEVPGMALYPLRPPPERQFPLRIERERHPDGIAIFARVCADAFGRPPGLADVFTPDLLAAPGLEAYLAWMDDAPVATAMLMRTGDVAGIYSVGTLPEWRGRGIGEAVTWHAVERGRELGCTMASLQASEMGQPVYERMGFRTVSRYRTYVPREL